MKSLRPVWPLITTKQAAERYEVKPKTVNVWVKEGLEPCGKWGREYVFHVATVIRWLWINRPNKRIYFLDAAWASSNVREAD